MKRKSKAKTAKKPTVKKASAKRKTTAKAKTVRKATKKKASSPKSRKKSTKKSSAGLGILTPKTKQRIETVLTQLEDVLKSLEKKAVKKLS